MHQGESPIEAARQQLLDEFLGLPDWVDRYHFIIEQGRRLPSLSVACRRRLERVYGCPSLVGIRGEGDVDRLRLLGTADCPIDAGLLAMVFRIYDGQCAEDVVTTPGEFIRQLQLPGRMSAQRIIGVSMMVHHVRNHALELLLAARLPVCGNRQTPALDSAARTQYLESGRQDSMSAVPGYGPLNHRASTATMIRRISAAAVPKRRA